MWQFVLLGLLIYLIIIIISVCAYPFICACIAVACKKNNELVTGLLLLLTLIIYILACTTLEHSLENWCYSVYASIVLTPLTLYICTGLEDPSIWLGFEKKPQHSKITIPILTFCTSLFFTIEGCLRMTHSNSVFTVLKNGLSSSETYSYRSNSEEFQYAGSLLFCVSIVSLAFIGFLFFSNYKEYQRSLKAEREKKSRIEDEMNKITQKLKKELECLMSFESQQVDETILHYNTFCQKIIKALESCDEKIGLSFKYGSFNNIKTPYKVLLISKKTRNYYFFPMSIVVKKSDDTFQYIPIDRTTVTIKTEKRTKRNILPVDVKPIRQFWLHSRPDGSPDLRYSFNPKIFVYEYGIVSLGDFIIHVYRMNIAKDVVSAFDKLYTYISQMKVQKPIVKKETILDDKVPSSLDLIEYKQVIKQVKQPEEVKTIKQPITVENPETLEDCFCDIIQKRGKDILKDKNLVNIISSLYKEVDLTEYKDVLDEMVMGNFLYQFVDPKKQNDFVFYNLSNSFARQKKINVHKSLYITQALVTAIKRVKP